MLLKIILFCLILKLGFSTQKTRKNEEKDVFQATHDWQEIKGKKVPSGLHYRINLSTGKKEAKINEDDGQASKNSFAIVNQDPRTDEIKFRDQKNFRNKETIEISKDETKKIRTRYRSIEELKKELGDLNIIPKTDAEIIAQLFSDYEEVSKKREPDKKRILIILKDLIYLSHQIDNAIEFVKLDGFHKIVYKNLNSTDDQILQDTLKLFSSLVQNNSKVKIHALETGSISKLLKIFNLSTSSKVKYSTLIALSCFLRTFPFAQNSFIELGGLNVFSEEFELVSDTKLKLKIVTLVDDLLVERENDPKNFEGHKQIDLKEMLVKLNWCSHLSKLLSEVAVIDLNDHDSIEKCLTAMNSLKDKCGGMYTKDSLISLNVRYEALANQTSDIDFKEFYRNLSELSFSLVIVNNTNSGHRVDNVKQEL